MKETHIEKRYVYHKGVLDKFDDVLKDPIWEQNSFLKANKEKLQQLRNKFNKELGLDTGYLEKFDIETDKKANVQHADQIRIHVLVYNAGGRDMKKWSNVIGNLTGKVITMPIYRVEEDIRTVMRAKENSKNEGYVVVYISNSDLLQSPDGKPHLDRFGHELLSIKDGSIKRENIDEFVHVSGRYFLKYNRLVLKTDGDNS